MAEEMKIGEVSKRLRTSVSNVRYWSSDEDYREHLSPPARGDNKGATRLYSEEDALILLTIKESRDKGLTKEQILQRLQARLCT